MRYMLIQYFRKPSGQLDESMTVAKRLRTRDYQTASVIIDFRDLKVLQAHFDGHSVPKDFDRIVQYYNQYYATTIQRLFNENGYTVEFSDKDPAPDQSTGAADNPAPPEHKP